MTVLNPLDHPAAYDHIILGDALSPGVVKLSGHDRKIGWDIKKGSGQSGATTTRSSDDPVEFTCTFFLADREDFEAWPDFLAVINSTVAGPTPKAVDIYHPDLAENEIKSVVLSGKVGTTHDGLGGQTKTVKFLEYRPPKKKGGSPKGSKSGSPAKKAPDPNQAALDEIARLTAQYQATPWG